MRNIIQIIIFIVITITFLNCEKYELCTETPAIDTSIAFRVVDENGKDLAYDKTYHYNILKILDDDGNNIIRHYYEDKETEQAFFYIETFKNLSIYNSSEYILRYNFSTLDTLHINVEWTQNACDAEYSKINSISRGSTEFEKVDNVFIIVKD